MEPIFLTWPTVMLMTFTSAMNLLKWRKQNNIEATVNRHDVYVHMTNNERRFKKLFQRGIPWEKQIYEYMDRLIKEGFFDIVDEREFNNKSYKDLTSTPKAEKIYEWLWIATNLKSKEDVGQIVREAVKDLELGAKEEDKLFINTLEEIKDQQKEGFPFSLSKVTLREALKDEFYRNYEKKS